MPQRKKRTRRERKSELQPRWWQSGTTWILSHFAAGYIIAAVMLGALFLVTATLGTVTNDDLAAAGVPHTGQRRDQVVYYNQPLETQTLPVFFEISKTREPRLLCGILPKAEDKVVTSSNIRISNRFGQRMQGILVGLEWVVGLFYNIHFPTTIETIAKEVLDPNFGQQVLEMQRTDLNKTQNAALLEPGCDAAVSAVLKRDPNALVCPTTWFLRSPNNQRELLAVGILTRCVTLADETQARSFRPTKDMDETAWLTKIKFQLGFLQTEVNH